MTFDCGFEILYEEGPCLVVCKPPGLPTQAPPGIESLETRIKAMLRGRPGGYDEPYLGIPHRLDRPASGAIVFGTRRRATHRLARQFEARSVKKTYWACVEGRPDPLDGTWRDCLIKVYGRPQAEVVPAEHPDGRPAVLHYRTLALAEWGAWLEIELETGRTHQIRIQAASRGFPLWGDFQYGAHTPFGLQHENQRLRAIALHARTLEFEHPTLKKQVVVTAPAAEYWPDADSAASR